MVITLTAKGAQPATVCQAHISYLTSNNSFSAQRNSPNLKPEWTAELVRLMAAHVATWTHRCAALSHCNATTFQNHINIHAINFYDQTHNNSWPPALTAPLPRREEGVTRSLPQLAETATVRDHFFHTYTRRWNQTPSFEDLLISVKSPHFVSLCVVALR